MFSLRSLGRGANLLSLARVPLAGAFVLVAHSVVGSIVVLALAALTDVLDGWYARRSGQSSAEGAAIDGIVDKIFVITVVIALVVEGVLPGWAAILLGVREVGELGIAAWLALLHPGRVFVLHSHHPLGKLTTLLQFGTVGASILRWSDPTTALALATGLVGPFATGAYAWQERALLGERRTSA